MTRIRWYGPALVLVFTVLLVMLMGPGLIRKLQWHRVGAHIELAREDNLSSLALSQLSEAFRNVATSVRPGVVHIQIEGRRISQRLPRDLQDTLPPFFRRYFNQPKGTDDEERPDLHRYDPFTPFGSGSGWVYDDRHIVTNNHVIEHAHRITVKFSDETQLTAEVVGSDPPTDIAVLRIRDGQLHPIPLATAPVQQGEIVFAFGSPFNYEFSMSQGIVSAKGREIGILRARAGFEDFIQTDAAINRGNSGGPLTNIFGEVVGMNTAIATAGNPERSFNGMGFAIPAYMIREIVEDLIDDGKVIRGYLGVVIEDLTPAKAYTFGFEGVGILVVQPQEGFPAAVAGVQPDDIITRVNGQPVSNVKQLQDIVKRSEPGTSIALEIYRGRNPDTPGETLTVDVELVSRPEDPFEASLPNSPHRNEVEDDIIHRTEETLAKLGIEDITTARGDGRTQSTGVIVREVRPGSAAQAAGLGPGDVITAIFGTPVASRRALLAELGQYDATRPIRLRVTDGRTQRSVFLVLPNEESETDTEP